MNTEEQGNLFTQLSPYMNEYTILRIKELQLQNLPENKNTWKMQDELEVLKNYVVESIMDIIFDANKEVVEQKQIINNLPHIESDFSLLEHKDAKPIVVIYFPKEFTFQEGMPILKPLRLMQEFNRWGDTVEMRKGDRIDDYLWFCFFKENITEPEFKVFYSKDFTPIQYAELKKIIEDAVEKQKQLH